MIFSIHAQPGEGFAQFFGPVLSGKHTLYIGIKSRIWFLEDEWRDYRVTYSSFYRLPESLDAFDQVVIEGLPINPNTRRVKNLATLLGATRKPIYFRTFGRHVFDHILLEILRLGGTFTQSQRLGLTVFKDR